MLEIDGSYGEGGGQILRTSASLSLIMQKEIRIYNIRSKRKEKGLKNQHAKFLEFLSKVFNIKIKGIYVGSEEITIEKMRNIPQTIHENYDLETAASITLFLQGIIPIILYYDIPTNLTLKGGTNVKGSPSAEYYEYVLFPLLREFNFNLSLRIIKKGYYPKGGGEIELTYRKTEGIEISKQIPNEWFVLNEKKFNHIMHVEKSLRFLNLCKRAEEFLQNNLALKESKCLEVKALSQGVDGILYNNQCGIDYLGEKGKPLERILEERIQYLKECIKNNTRLDRYLSDQILLPLSIYSIKKREHLRFQIAHATSHFLTNMKIITQVFKFCKIELHDKTVSIYPIN